MAALRLVQQRDSAPSGLPAISPSGGEISTAMRNLPPCGGDVRQQRGT